MDALGWWWEESAKEHAHHREFDTEAEAACTPAAMAQFTMTVRTPPEIFDLIIETLRDLNRNERRRFFGALTGQELLDCWEAVHLISLESPFAEEAHA